MLPATPALTAARQLAKALLVIAAIGQIAGCAAIGCGAGASNQGAGGACRIGINI